MGTGSLGMLCLRNPLKAEDQFFEKSNDFLEGYERPSPRAVREYILAYAPSNPKMDGRFRKMSVDVKGKQFKIAASWLLGHTVAQPIPVFPHNHFAI
jgi:hypothetical protein